MLRNHLAHPAQARRRAFLIHQERRIQLAGGILHRHHQVLLAGVSGQPGVRRGVLMQHHAHHRTPWPLLAMRRPRLRRRHQTRPMQMQFGHCVAQHVVVPLAQLLVEMLHREPAVELAIQTQHPLDLPHRRAAR
jgi:hypothetical protein